MTARRGLSTLVLVATALAVGWAVGRRSHPAPPTSRSIEAARQLWTCSMHPQVLQDHPGQCPICGMQLTPVATDAPDATAVHIDPVVVQNMGVRVATVRRGRLAVVIRAVGVLSEAEPARHDVDLRVSGWIERLYADTEGMHLDAGAPLFDLYSPELQAAVGELIAARRARATEGTSGAASRVYDAASRKLELYGLPANEVARLARLERTPRTITFRSPIRGHLVTKNVVQGAAVERGTTVMRIVDHSRLWLDARVFEQDLPLVRLGQAATATITALPGGHVEGKVVFIHPHLDEATRTAMVRIEVANPTLVLRPGMYGTVEIATESPEATLLVPREAVIDTGRRRIAFVAEGNGRFASHDLTLGTESDGVVQVLGGLADGDQVVTSGQFLLDAESRLREAIQKHLAEGLATPPAGHEGHAR
jgi:Cu(I)/Ag(I) efflux system membrane fusion protein/cobalt-zinc-cadmium efflux system membrane fusion protein